MSDNAAVLLNNTGTAIVAFEWFWSYTSRSGVFESLNESLDLQQRTAQEAVNALQGGASVGRVFEIVRPLARHDPQPQPQGKPPRLRSPLPFGHEAVHHLLNASDTDLLAFFRRSAEPRSLVLRRPE